MVARTLLSGSFTAASARAVRSSSFQELRHARVLERAVSVLETFAKNNKKRIARFEIKDDGVTWRTRTMPTGSMDILLRTDAAREHLPNIRQLVSCPVLVEVAGARCEVLTAGYHEHGGGTYITKGEAPPIVPLSGHAKLVLAIAGVAGDLAESLLKRSVHTKDSGHALPGIGGGLDLIDSLLFTLPLFYLFLIAYIIHHQP